MVLYYHLSMAKPGKEAWKGGPIVVKSIILERLFGCIDVSLFLGWASEVGGGILEGSKI